jgi:transposase, IS5 family
MINNIIYEEPNKIRQLQLFRPEIGMKVEYVRFMTSELGALWQRIPFEALAQRIEQSVRRQGAHVPSWGWLDIKGALAAQVLKSYYNGISDKKLLEKINLNEVYQWFCFCSLKGDEQIKDKNLLWRWRAFLGTYMDLDSLNAEQLMSWKSSLEHLHFRMSDATVYEVNIAYPTGVKLLWQSCEWVYGYIPLLGKILGLGTLSKHYTHYGEQKARQRSYDKSRRKTHKQTKSRIRQLLFWLEKGIGLLEPLLAIYQQQYAEQVLCNGHGLKPLKAKILDRFKTIMTVYGQQKQQFDDPKAKIEGRIVSLHQPHIRPIIRGKEVKKVEFGPKVNMLRVGGINLIERYSFDNFNETTCFERACTVYEPITGKCKQMGADAIYATNKNRRFATDNHIATGFKIKGKLPKDELKKQQKIMAHQTIHTLRATHMEGSFGNEKQHYDLLKIKAKTPQTQIATLFCSILTANAMTLIAKDRKKEKQDKIDRLNSQARAA